MKRFTCSYYRPEKVNTTEFDNIIGKLEDDLNWICSETLAKSSIYNYIVRLLREAKPLERNPKMYFLGFCKPQGTPEDCRVAYYFWPTYLATAIIIKAILLHPDLMIGKLDDMCCEGSDMFGKPVEDIIRGLLLGCTARRFVGHFKRDIAETMEIFNKADTSLFIGRYPDLCPEFTELFNEVSDFMEGDPEYFLNNMDLECEKRHRGMTRVFVYGTLMKGQRAEHMLDGCTCLGHYVLWGYSMYNLGSYPGIVPAYNGFVTGEVYQVPVEKLEELDRYEGEGSLYIRQLVKVHKQYESLAAEVYVYNHNVSGEAIYAFDGR